MEVKFNLNIKLFAKVILIAGLIFFCFALIYELKSIESSIQNKFVDVDKNTQSIQGIVNYINAQIQNGILPSPVTINPQPAIPNPSNPQQPPQPKEEKK